MTQLADFDDAADEDLQAIHDILCTRIVTGKLETSNPIHREPVWLRINYE
jgi:hypothetical protein